MTNLHVELFAMRFAGIRITPPAAVAGIQLSTASNRRRAPWPDWMGNPIFEGDVIQHPVSGERGTVVFLAGEPEAGDAWRVEYGTSQLSRLCLQIGEKGRAVVISRLPNIQS